MEIIILGKDFFDRLRNISLHILVFKLGNYTHAIIYYSRQ